MRHPFLDHLAWADSLEAESPHVLWTTGDAGLPSLFLSHGAPPVFEDAQWMSELYNWARSFPKPKAILMVSAHWESAPLSLSAASPTGLVYDFGGFAQMYYEMKYETPDATDLALLVSKVLNGEVHQHERRGLDHGAWVPLKVMYPKGDVPVLQMSIPTHDERDLIELGRRLRELRNEGVLVIGSGHMTHGLQYINWGDPVGVPAWSSEFDAWATEALERHDIDELIRFRERAPGMPYSHPTVEHFIPLFVSLGVADDPEANVKTTIDGYMLGLSKRSVQIG